MPLRACWGVSEYAELIWEPAGAESMHAGLGIWAELCDGQCLDGIHTPSLQSKMLHGT